jgi:hypothetical protein
MQYKLNNNCNCKKVNEPFQNILSESEETVEPENTNDSENTTNSEDTTSSEDSNNSENSENISFFEKIDIDLDEIIGESKIEIGDSTYLVKDYKYWIIILLFILTILIIRTIT